MATHVRFLNHQSSIKNRFLETMIHRLFLWGRMVVCTLFLDVVLSKDIFESGESMNSYSGREPENATSILKENTSIEQKEKWWRSGTPAVGRVPYCFYQIRSTLRSASDNWYLTIAWFYGFADQKTDDHLGRDCLDGMRNDIHCIFWWCYHRRQQSMYCRNIVMW